MFRASAGQAWIRSLVPGAPLASLAPLDAWCRLLSGPGRPFGLRFLPRLALGLAGSTVSTVVTLPERLVLAPVLRAGPGRAPARVRHGPGLVIILGYYRTGTTHLHYLFSCDRALRAPTWAEVMAPQGFVLSWTLLRLLVLLPALPNERPQDGVAFGPEWPAEDDFALANWTLSSSLPGRFLLPSAYAHYRRFHDLEGLSPRELARWRWTQAAFVRKIAWLARDRPILLKTPSHTAHLDQTLAMLDGVPVRLVHISRSPEEVVQSNIAMVSRLARYMLEDPPDRAELEQRIVEEYDRTERRYCEAVERLAASVRRAEIRYEDLIAAPVEVLRQVYDELDLTWTPQTERAVWDYLAATSRHAAGTPSSEPRRTRPQLAWIAERFGHLQPLGVPAGSSLARNNGGGDNPSPGRQAGRHRAARLARAVALAPAVAIVVALGWTLAAWGIGARSDWLLWPAGLVTGHALLRAARRGTPWLGVSAAGATLAAWLIAALPATFMAEYFGRGPRYWEWYHISKSTRVGVWTEANLIWAVVGSLIAYRLASRRYAAPPGR